MTNTILLARHGTHDEVGRVLSGRSEIALNVAGREEAEAMARTLRDVPLGSIHASPRRRTMETALPVAHEHGLSVVRAAALDEIDFGRFTGLAFDALESDADWRAWNEHRGTARCPGGETMAEVIARAGAYLRALSVSEAPILCVTHCDVIRGLVADARGDGLDRLYALPCDPGSLTEVVVTGERLCVVALNRRPG